ncbi:MAG: hypothetical protein ACI9MC_002998 [Kiritimatiellia bacterium]|jgi:hypothetical protein
MRNLALSLSLLLMTGCLTEVDIPLDLDADGLLSSEEEELGTNPENPDSDGDGHLDGDEIDGGFDPLDEYSHPYMGGWPTDAGCRDGHQPAGNDAGDLTAEFHGITQHDEVFNSLDFCGKVILLEVGAFW